MTFLLFQPAIIYLEFLQDLYTLNHWFDHHHYCCSLNGYRINIHHYYLE